MTMNRIINLIQYGYPIVDNNSCWAQQARVEMSFCRSSKATKNSIFKDSKYTNLTTQAAKKAAYEDRVQKRKKHAENQTAYFARQQQSKAEFDARELKRQVNAENKAAYDARELKRQVIAETQKQEKAAYEARVLRRAQQSAIPAGRMRETDTIKDGSVIPNTAGLYHHINKETKTVDYVGQSDTLKKRQQEHARSGKLNTDTHFVRYAESKNDATKDQLLETEKAHIAKHKPSGNTTIGGNGRR